MEFGFAKEGVFKDTGVMESPIDYSEIVERINRHAGLGSYNYALVDFMRNHDKFGTTSLPGNSLRSGFTFITRPSLCLATEVISKEQLYYPMVTDDVNSMEYGIRAILDPTFYENDCVNHSGSPLVSQYNPFNDMWGSGLIGMSGVSDISLDSETVGPGYMGEDQTRYKSYDFLTKTHSLNLQFRDIQGGPIFKSMFYMLMNMAHTGYGQLPIYLKDAEQYRLFYTVSMYRFVTDASFRYIKHYYKLTGCYPDALNTGELANFSETERVITAGGELSVPFKCNHIAYNEPWILKAFNRLVRRYYNAGGRDIRKAYNIPMDALNNYNGIPYIGVSSDNQYIMTFREE